MDSAAYARQLKALLPPGRLFRLDPDSALSKMLRGLGEELARIDGRAADLVEEWDASTTVEMIEDWERALGITPGESDTDDTRRVAIVAQLGAQGGQTAAYLLSLATALGFSATGAVTATHVWTLTVDLSESTSPWTPVETFFRTGTARAGDPLMSYSLSQLEAVINRAKPAHVRVLFVYEA